MAVLERINFQPVRLEPTSTEGLSWVVDDTQTAISALPQIFHKNGEPWMAANGYAIDQIEGGKNLKTVLSVMNHLRDYAGFLENENLDWRHFPLKKRDRCLFRYRGHLVERREEGALTSGSASARMAAVLRFYRWAVMEGLIQRENLWEERQKVIRTHNHVGLKRTLAVTSSELALPSRQRPGSSLEGGVLPVSDSSRKTLLDFLRRERMIELYLMFLIGFSTGARIETIRTLRLSTLESGRPEPGISSMQRVPVGPPTPVKTKYGVRGNILFPTALIRLLQRYATSARRLSREARASDENKTLLFLTSPGRKYEESSFTSLMSKLRNKLIKNGHEEFDRLKFHQSRATFGTQLMRLCMATLKRNEDALVFVRDAMLHKDESTTWKYITFMENEPLKEKLSDDFFYAFSGQEDGLDELIEKVDYE